MIRAIQQVLRLRGGGKQDSSAVDDKTNKKQKVDINDERFFIKSRYCIHESCEKRTNFGFHHGIAMYCGTHKLANMENTKSKMCCICKKVRPVFGHEGQPASHCKTCKEPNMVDVVSKMCCICKQVQPVFGHEGQPATHCTKCKEPNMVNVVSTMCCVCKKVRPVFGHEGQPASHCAKCKEPNMVDVVSKMCCVCKQVQRNFGHEGQPASHCAKCKEPNMVNVVSTMCCVCKKVQRNFGHEGQPATHCAKCKEPNMVNVVSKMCCVCKQVQPVFGHEGQPATHCTKCKEPNMVDVVSKMCTTCGNSRALVDAKFLDNCFRCFATLFPESPLVLSRNKTENMIHDYLNTLNANVGYMKDSYNCRNAKGHCAPQWFKPYEADFLLLDTKVNLEIDGGQHKEDNAYFGTTASSQILNDCNKSLLCLRNSVSVIRLDQPTIWNGSFINWRSVLSAMILFGYFRAVDGKPCVITSRSNVTDLSYAPYLEMLMIQNTDNDIFEMYHSGDYRNSIICCNYRTGQEYLVHIPPTIDLSGIPASDITLSLIADKKKDATNYTLDLQLPVVVPHQVQVPETLAIPLSKITNEVFWEKQGKSATQPGKSAAQPGKLAARPGKLAAQPTVTMNNFFPSLKKESILNKVSTKNQDSKTISDNGCVFPPI